ncbi:hypothetical protein [Kochikohdavirus PBEF19]|uniref:Uncharacterized protein n=1 Tax=Enterococcus phage PBEF129 TaxID=2696337 RepID=A0A7T3JEK9_9CAUD|nr:hypothetical protein [Enterococcus phage PBEF129]
MFCLGSTMNTPPALKSTPSSAKRSGSAVPSTSIHTVGTSSICATFVRWTAKVDLPLEFLPKTSTIRPNGNPPPKM